MLKEFKIGDYLNSDADIQALLESLIEDQNEQVLKRCIIEIASLKGVNIHRLDSFHSVSQALNAIGYKFVIKKSKT